jgi:hypothetical protein
MELSPSQLSSSPLLLQDYTAYKNLSQEPTQQIKTSSLATIGQNTMLKISIKASPLLTSGSNGAGKGAPPTLKSKTSF